MLLWLLQFIWLQPHHNIARDYYQRALCSLHSAAMLKLPRSRVQLPEWIPARFVDKGKWIGTHSKSHLTQLSLKEQNNKHRSMHEQVSKRNILMRDERFWINTQQWCAWQHWKKNEKKNLCSRPMTDSDIFLLLLIYADLCSRTMIDSDIFLLFLIVFLRNKKHNKQTQGFTLSALSRIERHAHFWHIMLFVCVLRQDTEKLKKESRYSTCFRNLMFPFHPPFGFEPPLKKKKKKMSLCLPPARLQMRILSSSLSSSSSFLSPCLSPCLFPCLSSCAMGPRQTDRYPHQWLHRCPQRCLRHPHLHHRRHRCFSPHWSFLRLSPSSSFSWTKTK